jgi:uncharacterized protein YidB (DUF937 family)
LFNLGANSGQGGAIRSWIGNGPNQSISPKDLASAIGNDALDTLAKHTGMSRDDLLTQLKPASFRVGRSAHS